MKLKHKILAVLLAMGAIAACGTPITLLYLQNLAQLESLALQTKSGQATLERINGLVYAVVMASRGIYMSVDKDKARPFGDSMLAALRSLGTYAQRLSDEALPVEADAVTAARRHVDQFIQFRADMVRISREDSPAAARVLGDNDANRTNRKALNDTLKALSDRYEQHALTNVAEAQHLRSRVMTIVLLLGALPVVATIMGMVVVLTGFTRPIERIKSSILALAGGDTRKPYSAPNAPTSSARSRARCRSSRTTFWKPKPCAPRPRRSGTAAKRHGARPRTKRLPASVPWFRARSAQACPGWLPRISLSASMRICRTPMPSCSTTSMRPSRNSSRR